MSPWAFRCRSRCARWPRFGNADLPAAEIARMFRAEYGRAVAVLTRDFGDLDLPRRRCRTRSGAVERWPEPGAAQPGGLDHHDGPQPGDRSLRREASRDDRHARRSLRYAECAVEGEGVGPTTGSA